MTTPALWIGDSRLQLQPELRITESADSTTTTFSYSGPYELCVSSKPNRGQSVAGFPGVVASTELLRKPGGVGLLTITVVAQNADSDLASAILETKWQLRWMEARKPLASHPRYTALNKGYGSAAFGTAKSSDLWIDAGNVSACREITVAYIMEECAKATMDEANAIIAKGTDINQVALVRDYLGKLARSTEGYKLFYPVLTKTTTSSIRPAGTGAGFILASAPSSPLLGSVPNHADYKWFKDADDVTSTGRSGSYERSEVWIGADDIDSDLYRTHA